MINWLFICNAILRYAEKNMLEIFKNPSKISIIDVLNYYKDNFKRNSIAEFLSEYLIAYYKDKCAIFAKDYAKGDVLSMHDINEDKNYTFSYKGIVNLF